MPTATKEPKEKFKLDPQQKGGAPPVPDCATPGCGNQGGLPAQAQSNEVRGGGAQQGQAQQGQAQQGQAQQGGTQSQSAGPQATSSPEPGTGGSGTPAPPTDEQRWTAVQALLQQSALGQQALQRQTQYSVALVWWNGPGSAYNPSSNTMNIDRNRPNERVALTFIHEMNHAYYQNAGLGAHGASNNISTMTREAYVTAMLNEESEGTALSIEGKMELEAAGNTIAPVYPLEAEYRAAYQASISGGGSVSDAKAAGRARVLQGFRDGEVQTSTTPNTPYPDYYGQAWDRAHPGGAGGGATGGGGGSWI